MDWTNIEEMRKNLPTLKTRTKCDKIKPNMCE